MAQKSLKLLAARNARTLNTTHLISLIPLTLYILLRVLLPLLSSSPTRPSPSNSTKSHILTLLLSSPAIAIQAFFEYASRPTHASTGGEVRRPGQDLEAKGLTEWMWDVLYWTWGCVVLVALVGDWAWWFYIVVPLYSAWLAYTTFTGMRQGLGMGPSAGAGGGGQDEGGASGDGGSKRQKKKMEKRGGQQQQQQQQQRMGYR